MTQQIPLQFEIKTELSFDNFVAGPNKQALMSVENLVGDDGWDFVYLWGAKNLGKSHLLQATCAAMVAADFTVCYFDFNELVSTSPKILEGLEIFQLVALDNLHLIAGKPDWEEACFDCYNRLQVNNCKLLVSANAPPNEINFGLPDLKSRMQSAVVYALKPLSDEQKVQVLKLRAAAKGLRLTDDVGLYLINHYQRGLSQLIKVLDKLDHASMVSKRKLTIPFVRSVIKLGG